MTREGVERAAALLDQARKVVVSTGAGMSKESGIPTFRDAREGLWARFDPEQLATEAGFRAAPARVWAWYEYRRGLMRGCRPHAGHTALVELERLVPEFTIVTQNIDGLHQIAGSSDVIELHGSIHRQLCIDCRRAADPSLGARDEEPRDEEPGAELEPPRCTACGAHFRPAVVWFGEMLPADAVERAWRIVGACDLLLVVGTSGVVWPAAELPHIARAAGAAVVEVNPDPSEVTPHARIYLRGQAGELLPALVEGVIRRRRTGG